MKVFLTTSLLFVLASLRAFAIPQNVHVSLFEARASVPELRIVGRARLVHPVSKSIDSSSGQYSLRAERGRVALYAVSKKQSAPLLKSARLVFEEPGARGTGLLFPGRQSCFYRGELVITVRNSGLFVENIVPAREFVYSIVASELPFGFHAEAKKALAVLTLTRLEFLPDRRAIGDSTKSELYTGCRNVRVLDRESVDQVFGERLYYKSRLVLPYYHSTCSGGTSSGAEFFKGNGEDLGYLRAVICEHCKESPFYLYKETVVQKDKIRRIFDGALPVVLKRDRAERALLVDTGKQPISGYRAWLELGRAIGWGAIPGTRYYIYTDSKRQLGDKDLVIKSNGAGHGVGLCQWGAQGLAKSGKDYRQILRYYFPDCQVK